MAIKQLCKFNFDTDDSYISKLYTDLLKILKIKDETHTVDLLMNLSVYSQNQKWIDHLI